MNILKDIWDNPTKYNKFWIALASVVVAILTRRFGADSEVVQDIVMLLGALGVVLTPNKKV